MVFSFWRTFLWCELPQEDLPMVFLPTAPSGGPLYGPRASHWRTLWFSSLALEDFRTVRFPSEDLSMFSFPPAGGPLYGH